MRKVQIYVDNQRIDLFQDEKIEVKSSIQNISDIAKVFTDFSQSFTVPASDVNNDIFGFYYNNDLDQFDANVRVACRIEIDFVPFREGKLQLEGSVIKNNQVEAYKVSFYGDVVTLKDLLGEDKLKDLNYTSLNTAYDGATVLSSLTTTTYLPVRFPLISSERVWTYDTGGASAEDISISSNPIVYTELFPAVSDLKILELIESKYGVTFTGNFLSDTRLSNSYTWWKNRETTNFTSEALDMEFNAGGIVCDADLPNNIVGIDEVNIQYIDMNTFTQPALWQIWTGAQFHRIDVLVDPTTSGTWYLDMYKDGVLENTWSNTTTQLVPVLFTQNVFGLNNTYTFKLRSQGSITFDFTVKYTFVYQYQNTSNAIVNATNTCSYSTSGVSTVNVLDFSSSAPDQKISEWFSGTLKEFNLTCYPVDTLTYQLEPLEDWYAGGDTVDITPYVDTNEIEVDRVKLYNEIIFEWEKSKSFMNTAFEGFNGREYGDLKATFPNNDGGKYNVKLPFENMLFNNFDTINNTLQVGYCLTNAPDYKAYVPKPVKLYLNTVETCSFYFNDGTTTAAVVTYMPFGQSTTYNTAQFSMNFGLEIDSLTNNAVPNSLYQTYYEPYLLNLFDSKSRQVTVKCVLPLNILTKLTLDDALLIRDKKYRINDMTTDLTSGLVKLVLLSDWVEDRVRTPSPIVPEAGGTIDVPIKPPKGGWIDIANPVESKFITSSPTLPATNETDEQVLVITVPSNATRVDRYQTIIYAGYNPDGSEAWERTIVIEQSGSTGYLLTETGGYLLTESLDRILL